MQRCVPHALGTFILAGALCAGPGSLAAQQAGGYRTSAYAPSQQQVQLNSAGVANAPLNSANSAHTPWQHRPATTTASGYPLPQQAPQTAVQRLPHVAVQPPVTAPTAPAYSYDYSLASSAGGGTAHLGGQATGAVPCPSCPGELNGGLSGSWSAEAACGSGLAGGRMFEAGSYPSACNSATIVPPLAGGARRGWFGSVGLLVMNRDQENFFPFSYDSADESIQLVDSREASMDASAGAEARIGHYFGCGQYAIEFVHFAIYPESEAATTLGADVGGSLNGIFNWSSLTYNSVGAGTLVDNAVAHRITRDYEFQNIELNLLAFQQPAQCGPWNLHTIIGLRYFRFEDTLNFASDTVDASFTGAAEEINYLTRTKNQLFGLQFGGRGEYCLTRRLSLTAGVKTGVYANEIDLYSRIGGSAGTAVINNGPNSGEAFLVENSKTRTALIGEVDLGLAYRFNSCWQLALGYRGMGVSGVALPTNQIYFDLRGIEDVAIVDANGDLILHGGYVNLLYNY